MLQEQVPWSHLLPFPAPARPAATSTILLCSQCHLQPGPRERKRDNSFETDLIDLKDKTQWGFC